MEMRKAELDKKYNKVLHSQGNVGITKISCTSEVFPAQEVKIKSSLLIYGINGSGKTNFLKTISGSIGEDTQGLTFLNNTIDIKHGKLFCYISPSDTVVDTKSKCTLYLPQENHELLAETLLQYHPTVFDDDALSGINYVLSSKFLNISVYEIDSFEEDVLFIKTEDDNGTRDIYTLSHGEIYCILLYWYIVFKLEDKHIVIDEPETYLYPSAQQRLIDLIVSIVDYSTRQTIIATHSRDIVYKLSIGTTLRVEKLSGEEFLFFDGTHTDSQVFELGLKTKPPIIFIVEDNKAKLFLQNLIFKSELHPTRGIYILTAKNGESDLSQIYKRILNTDSIDLVLCYDADINQEGKNGIPEDVSAVSISLPGQDSPEEEVINVINMKNADYINLFENKAVILGALRKAQGNDHHDFFKNMSVDTNIQEHELFSKGIELWKENNKELVTTFLNIIKTKI
ncbi:AAA family ATPase [Aeromonas veronii]|uniref:AAA family ATPase n=2 Tax=Aeromonas veronii TaxID=654 RepID=UPI00191D450E|nr:AAA family ATPase [Aeromonas veronii]